MQRLSLMTGLCALLFTGTIAAQDVYRVSDQVTAPQTLTVPKPTYTATVMRKMAEGVEGFVELEVDVMPDGTVGTVALVKSLDPELDADAARAVKTWKFTPGMKNGKPVAVRTMVRLAYGRRSLRLGN